MWIVSIRESIHTAWHTKSHHREATRRNPRGRARGFPTRGVSSRRLHPLRPFVRRASCPGAGPASAAAPGILSRPALRSGANQAAQARFAVARAPGARSVAMSSPPPGANARARRPEPLFRGDHPGRRRRNRRHVGPAHDRRVGLRGRHGFRRHAVDRVERFLSRAVSCSC